MSDVDPSTRGIREPIPEGHERPLRGPGDAPPAWGGPAPAASVLRAQGLHKRYTEGGLDVPVLQGVDLEVRKGETLAIVGASGSGKSTLLHLLGGLEAPSQGKVQLAGRDFAQMAVAEQGEWRNKHFGFIY